MTTHAEPIIAALNELIDSANSGTVLRGHITKADEAIVSLQSLISERDAALAELVIEKALNETSITQATTLIKHNDTLRETVTRLTAENERLGKELLEEVYRSTTEGFVDVYADARKWREQQSKIEAAQAEKHGN